MTHLTPREKEVYDLKREGLSAKMIAKRLGVTYSSVTGHVHTMLVKFNVNSFVQLERAIERENPPVYRLTNQKGKEAFIRGILR